MEIKVYSKADCGKCESAKDKIKRMGFDYEDHSLEYHITPHDGWRTDGSTRMLASLAFSGDPSHQLPTIEIDGEFYDYSGAMKELKRRKNGNA